MSAADPETPSTGAPQAAVPVVPHPTAMPMPMPASSTSTDSGGDSVREGGAAASPRPVPLTSIATIDMQEGLPPDLEELRGGVVGESRLLISEPSLALPYNYNRRAASSSAPPLQQQPSKKTLNEELGDHAFLAMLPSLPFPGWFRLRRPTAMVKQITRLPRSFILLKVRGWVWFAQLLYPQLLLAVAITLVAYHCATKKQRNGESMSDLQKVHGLIGTILSFTIGFRTNSAYNHYYEGRRLMGSVSRAMKEVVSETYAALNQALHKDNEAHAQEEAKEGDRPNTETKTSPSTNKVDDLKVMTEAAIEIRRKLNLLLAFIRQDIRESVMGFIPGSKLEMQDVLFDYKGNYHWDPCRPRLWDLLDKQELHMYADIPTHNRPLLVVGELKALSAAYARNFLGLLNSMLDSHEAMTRIRDTPVPFPYIAVLNVTTFVFVYCTPFIYLRVGLAGTMVGTLLLALCYYGVSMIAVQLENPFGYDPFDLPMERYCLQAHDDSCMLAKALADDTTSFVPQYLSQPLPLHLKDVSPALLATPQGASLLNQ